MQMEIENKSQLQSLPSGCLIQEEIDLCSERVWEAQQKSSSASSASMCVHHLHLGTSSASTHLYGNDPSL